MKHLIPAHLYRIENSPCSSTTGNLILESVFKENKQISNSTLLDADPFPQVTIYINTFRIQPRPCRIISKPHLTSLCFTKWCHNKTLHEAESKSFICSECAGSFWSLARYIFSSFHRVFPCASQSPLPL